MKTIKQEARKSLQTSVDIYCTRRLHVLTSDIYHLSISSPLVGVYLKSCSSMEVWASRAVNTIADRTCFCLIWMNWLLRSSLWLPFRLKSQQCAPSILKISQSWLRKYRPCGNLCEECHTSVIYCEENETTHRCQASFKCPKLRDRRVRACFYSNTCLTWDQWVRGSANIRLFFWRPAQYSRLL